MIITEVYGFITIMSLIEHGYSFVSYVKQIPWKDKLGAIPDESTKEQYHDIKLCLEMQENI